MLLRLGLDLSYDSRKADEVGEAGRGFRYSYEYHISEKQGKIVLHTWETKEEYFEMAALATAEELNYNAQTKTAGGGTALVYTIITFGIYGFYWFYMQGKKVDEINGNTNGSTGMVYIILAIFGLGIIPYCLMQSEINKIA